MEFKKLTYHTMLNNCSKNFLSLDISVNSTGYVLWYDKNLYYGAWHLNSKENRERRLEFGKHIAELLKGKSVDYIVIEDIIGGCNFKTTRILTELNIVPETLMDFGVIKNVPVYRKDNKEWKRELKILSQEEIIKGNDDKEMIVSVLNSLDFCIDGPQDIYDAMGIALAYLYSQTVKSVNVPELSVRKLKTDLTKGYKIKQHTDKQAMLEYANSNIKRARKKREILYIEYDSKYRNLVAQFNDIVCNNGDEKLFCIHAPLNKIGAMIITQGFDISKDDVYFTAMR